MSSISSEYENFQKYECAIAVITYTLSNIIIFSILHFIVSLFIEMNIIYNHIILISSLISSIFTTKYSLYKIRKLIFKRNYFKLLHLTIETRYFNNYNEYTYYLIYYDFYTGKENKRISISQSLHKTLQTNFNVPYNSFNSNSFIYEDEFNMLVEEDNNQMLDKLISEVEELQSKANTYVSAKLDNTLNDI